MVLDIFFSILVYSLILILFYMAIIVCFLKVSLFGILFLDYFSTALKYAGYVFPFEFRSLCIGCADTVKLHYFRIS